MSEYLCKQRNIKLYTNGKTVTTNFPPIHRENNTSEEIIREAVFRSMNYTSKFIGKCELSNKFYGEDKIITYRIPGAYALINHDLAGHIMYHPNNEFLKKDAETLFECEYKIIMRHSLKNRIINIYRSNGGVSKANILEESPIHINKNNELCVYSEFENDGVNLCKWIPIKNRFSKSLQTEVPGLLELNPEIKDDCIIIDIVNNHPEWLNSERADWFKTIKHFLDDSELKYKFNYI